MSTPYSLTKRFGELIKQKEFGKAKITIVLVTLLGVITLLYVIGIIAKIPCQTNLWDTFTSNFVHLEWWHLLGNLLILLTFIPLEVKLGSSKFLLLVLIILLLQTLITWVLRNTRAGKNIKCSIGFSGILYGLFVWSLFSERKIEWLMLIAIIASIVLTAVKDNRISWLGHTIGLLSGLLALLITKYLWPKNKPFIIIHNDNENMPKKE